jgi:hypothetical protein
MKKEGHGIKHGLKIRGCPAKKLEPTATRLIAV